MGLFASYYTDQRNLLYQFQLNQSMLNQLPIEYFNMRFIKKTAAYEHGIVIVFYT